MEATVKSPVMLYTEQTPNPESLKFVTNKMLYRGTADFREVSLAKEWSPLATALFDLPYVKGVYVCNNFITITKEFNYAWEDIMLKTKEFIKQFIENEGVIVNEGFAEAMEKIETEQRQAKFADSADGEISTRIKELIDTYVKPAVEMDGGNIEFKAFDNGIVYVVLQGSCSGCPSSTVTLKQGIEGMLKRMVPEVTEVVSEMG
jgi:NFU1 iron-sulfur cluster scaffold homolog, mitochondrial